MDTKEFIEAIKTAVSSFGYSTEEVLNDPSLIVDIISDTLNCVIKVK